MSLASDIAVLRRVPFFESFGDEHLRLLAFGGENIKYKTDDVLFHIGDATDGGLVILSGQISLSKDGVADDGERFKVGSLIGQRALLTPTKRRATAVAVSPVEVMLVRRSLFLRMLSEYPDLAARLHEQMSAELHRLTDQAVAVVGDG
ncbi:MAG: Crp/Fnr family transcriptional regulator [Pseudomonadota bacterium]